MKVHLAIYILGILSISGMNLAITAQTNKAQSGTLKWKELALLPDPKVTDQVHLGLAGPVCGTIGDYIIVAGGANFPDGPPWLGGKKQYHDEVFILKKNFLGKICWKTINNPVLTMPIAYSANVNLEDALVSIGGENDGGQLKNVFKYQIVDDELLVTELPSLPIPITNANATIIDFTIYLIGGTSGDKTLNTIYSLDLSSKGMNWKENSKMPLSVANAVVVSQKVNNEDIIFVIGGRYRTPNEVLTTFSDQVLKYNLINDSWSTSDFVVNGGNKLKLAAGTGVKYKKNQILLIGGDIGMIYNRIEELNHSIDTATNKENLIAQKKELLESHPGFYNNLFMYNVDTEECKLIGQTLKYPQVTTSAFYWKNQIIIPSGEIKPGVRTPSIMSLKIK